MDFTLPHDREKWLREGGFKEREDYYIREGNFYCKSKRLMVFILGGEKAARERTIDRYNWLALKLGDVSLQLEYTCTDAELMEAFKTAKARDRRINCPSVKQKLDTVKCPVGAADFKGLLNAHCSYVPLWSPENGKIFLLSSAEGTCVLNSFNDACCGFPLHFPSRP